MRTATSNLPITRQNVGRASGYRHRSADFPVDFPVRSGSRMPHGFGKFCRPCCHWTLLRTGKPALRSVGITRLECGLLLCCGALLMNAAEYHGMPYTDGDVFADTWVAVDGQGRRAPGFEECGP